MQEVQVLLVLVENIVNDLFLRPAHHIVILAPFLQMNLTAIVFMFLVAFLIFQPRQSKGRLNVSAQTNFIDKVQIFP
ncbi:hypothetical protein D3C78_1741010 [compost metagenome]